MRQTDRQAKAQADAERLSAQRTAEAAKRQAEHERQQEKYQAEHKQRQAEREQRKEKYEAERRLEEAIAQIKQQAAAKELTDQSARNTAAVAPSAQAKQSAPMAREIEVPAVVPAPARLDAEDVVLFQGAEQAIVAGDMKALAGQLSKIDQVERKLADAVTLAGWDAKPFVQRIFRRRINCVLALVLASPNF